MKLSLELIKRLDKLAPSPAENAARVFILLAERCPELTNQELQCFAVEYLASQVTTGELAFATDEVKALAKIYYLGHYYRLSCQTSPLTSNTKTESSSQDSTIKEG